MTDFDAAFKLHDLTNFYWNFYVVIVFAVVGWVVSRNDAWSREKRASVAVMFIASVGFSLVALVRTYIALDVVVAGLEGTATQMSTVTQQALARRLDMGPWSVGVTVHVIADIIVLYFVWVVAARAPSPVK